MQVHTQIHVTVQELYNVHTNTCKHNYNSTGTVHTNLINTKYIYIHKYM